MPESPERRNGTQQGFSEVDQGSEHLAGLGASPASANRSHGAVGSNHLSSARGIPDKVSKSISEVLNEGALGGNPQLSSVYFEEIKQLWLVARLDPRLDRGAELGTLLKLFCQDPSLQAHPELLSKLYSVATADELFGLTRAQYQERGIDFTKIRREFLVDIIRGAIDPDNITQGKEPLCTVATACKMLSKAEFLRLSTEYALAGSAVTQSGETMRTWPHFVERAVLASEGELGELRCARRSAGMLMTLYGMFQLGDEQRDPVTPLIERQAGLYWHQYTRMVGKLLNEQVALAHRSAKDITINPETGLGVVAGAAGPTKTVDLWSYVSEQLERGRDVFVDTLFDFSSSTAASGAEHQRHALRAERFVTRGGQLWVRCSNPIGDFVDTSKSATGHAEFFAAGTILGSRNGFWFETAENGDILVRADVLRRNLQTAIVQYGVPYSTENGARPTFIGDPEASQSGPAHYFDFSEDITILESEPVAVAINDVLEQLFAKQNATPTIRSSNRKQQQDGGGSPRESRKAKSIEEELLAAQAAELLIRGVETREDKRDDEPTNSTISSSPGGANANHASGQSTAPVTSKEPQTTTPLSTTKLGLKTLFG